jgi:hypothetical protein
MTEAEWLASVNTRAMLAFVSSRGSERIWRLFAVACVRGVEGRMRDARSRKALDVAERFADGAATRQELWAARARAEEAARQAHLDEWEEEARANFRLDPAYEAAWAARQAADAALACVAEEIDLGRINEGLQLPDLLREIFGNPFEWKEVDPAWLSSNGGAARDLAQMIYDQRAFDLLPILADALEEAGCTDADVLGHLRGPGAHVRGCWALDLLRGKG